MITKSFLDKSEFGEGPWQTEPDKAQWKDESTGLDCLIVRSGLGSLCGYVGVPLDSKLAGKDYGEIDVNIHGGLTYSSQCNGEICHLADEEVYWFGFDCAHWDDYTPITDSYKSKLRSRFYVEDYKDLNWVIQETTNLAQQIKKLL